MTITYRLDKGASLTYGELDENFHEIEERLAAADKCRMGWWDYDDTATAGSPIAITGGSTWYKLTNDGAGAQSQSTYAPSDVSEVWDTTNGQFDLSDLPLGSTVICRVTVNVTTSATNQEVDFRLQFGIGATPYTLMVGNIFKKIAGTYDGITLNFSFYIGNTLTKDNPAELQVNSADNGSVIVDGLFIQTLIRGEA